MSDLDFARLNNNQCTIPATECLRGWQCIQRVVAMCREGMCVQGEGNVYKGGVYTGQYTGGSVYRQCVQGKRMENVCTGPGRGQCLHVGK